MTRVLVRTVVSTATFPARTTTTGRPKACWFDTALTRPNIRRRRYDDHDHDVAILVPCAWSCDRLPAQCTSPSHALYKSSSLVIVVVVEGHGPQLPAYSRPPSQPQNPIFDRKRTTSAVSIGSYETRRVGPDRHTLADRSWACLDPLTAATVKTATATKRPFHNWAAGKRPRHFAFVIVVRLAGREKHDENGEMYRNVAALVIFLSLLSKVKSAIAMVGAARRNGRRWDKRAMEMAVFFIGNRPRKWQKRRRMGRRCDKKSAVLIHVT
jgi:hypothetical protein